jgi:hypothetical protein
MTQLKIQYQVISLGMARNVVRVYQVAPFGVPSGIPENIITAAGQLVVGLNAADADVLPAPAASAKILTSDTTEPLKMKWADPVASGVTSGPQSFGDNYVITPSIASNNLTVALLTIAGTDPSSSDPITVRIGNTKRSITAAISTTKNAGTNWCNAGSSELAAQDVDYFVYVIQETGGSAGTKLGFSRIPYAKTMGDFVNTTTNEKYIAGNWTNFNSTDEVENIGRFRAQNSGSASYNWSIPSAKVYSRPIYETDWLTYAPTLTGFSANPTSAVYQYRVMGDNVVLAQMIGANGTSNATGYTQTMPFTAKTLTNMSWRRGVQVVDNTTLQTAMGLATIASAASTIVFFKDASQAAFTNSGGKRSVGVDNLTYQI